MIKSVNARWILITLVFVTLIVAGYYILTQNEVSGEITEYFGSSTPSTKKVSVNLTDIGEQNHFKGNPEAPVTIIEWSDFECPICNRFYSETLWLIETKYINSGKVKFIYKHYPVTFKHANAQKAAEAAECAGEEGKFWEMHDMLFENGVNGGVDTFKSYASDLGLNVLRFEKCLDSGEMEKKVQNDIMSGIRLGIPGTPGFLINDNLVIGAQPFEEFKKIIEEELKND